MIAESRRRLWVAAVMVASVSCRQEERPKQQAGGPKPALMTPAQLQSLPALPPDVTIRYGKDPNQHGELRVPEGAGPHPVVVLIHGGCWKAEYATLRDLSPMGDALKADGVATWNIEYRRLRQPGGGWPGTYQDVGRAIDHLRSLAAKHRLDLERVAVLGHSAGGHLAMWAGTRGRTGRASPLYSPRPLPLRGVINLAGTVDMRENVAHMETACGDTVVTGLMGGNARTVPERYAEVSAGTKLPLGRPQLLIWGEYENFVPLALAERHVAAAATAGDLAKVFVVRGVGHFETASPQSEAWPAVREAIRSLLRN